MVNAWIIIEAFHLRSRGDLQKILVASFIFSKQKQVVALEGLTMDQALGGFASMLLEKMRVVETVPMQASESTTESEKDPSENLAAQKNSRMYPVIVEEV